MDTLVLKLLLTPALIAVASIAGRRWGQAVSGWFVGLPLTSGPIAFFVALVVLITEAAPTLGPRLSGVLGAFPVYAAILTVFTHRSGAAPAVQVLRGLLLGLFAFAGFFLVLGLLIERAGVALAFTAAIVTALVIQMGSLGLVLRSPKSLGA